MGHGKGSIRQNAEKAISLGLQELYITDHGPGHLFYGLRRKFIPIIRKEIDELNEEYRGVIKIYFGVEANVIDYEGKIDIYQDEMKYFDIINVGFHSGIRFKNIESAFIFRVLNPLSSFIPKLRNYTRQKNTEALINIVKNYSIRMITHPGETVDLEIRPLAEICSEKGTLLEINGHHPYLSVEGIKIADEMNCKFAVGSDAHSPEAIGQVEYAYERIEESGIDPSKVINIEIV